MGLFNFLLGVLTGHTVNNAKRNNNQHLYNRLNSNNHYHGSCYDGVECNCGHDVCNYDAYDNYEHYDNCYDDCSCDYESNDGYGYCDNDCEERY